MLSEIIFITPYIQVDIYQDKNTFNALNRYNIIVICEIQNYNYLIEINEYCMKNNIAFIYTGIFGLSRFFFKDFGNKHTVTKKNIFDNYSYNIDYLVKKKEVYEIILNLDSGKSIELNDEDYAKFKDIKGLE